MTASPLQILPPLRQPAPRPMRIALAGFGAVGQALAAKLRNRRDYEIAAILVRDSGRPRAVAPPAPPTSDRRAFLDAPADILIDALSCAETGALLAERALGRGVHVVSASRRVAGGCLPLLRAAAARTGAEFLYSAAVGGGAPVLETIAAARARGAIRSVEAVLNAAAGPVLARLAAGRSLGEVDPAAHLSGAAAAAALRLVAAEAWGADPREVDVEVGSPDKAAVARIEGSGEPWVQLSRATPDGAAVSLVPLRLAPRLPPIDVDGACALVTLADGSLFACSGKGAGAEAAAGSILTDLARLSALRAARAVAC